MIIDFCRDENDFRKFFDKYARNNHSIDGILALDKKYRPCFYLNDELIGCIYLEDKNEKVFLSGFSKPKQMNLVIEAIENVTSRVMVDVYAETPYREAKLVLLKSGFKKVQDNLYKKEV